MLELLQQQIKIYLKKSHNGSFRGDLYYRLNVFTIELISLKTRVEDISKLLNHFLIEISTKEGGTIKKISKEALKYIESYDWPGNIRELRNVIERAYYISDFSDEIQVEHLPRFLYSFSIQDNNYTNEIKSVNDIRRLNQEHERDNILNTLIEFKGNITKSSQHLGVSRNTLYKKIKEYNLSF